MIQCLEGDYVNAPFDLQLKFDLWLFDLVSDIALNLTYYLSAVLYWGMSPSVNVQGDYRMLC